MPKQSNQLIFYNNTDSMFGIFKSMFVLTDNTQLKNVIQEGALLVDVRTFQEFSTGTVKGAINIPLDQVTNQLAKFKGKTNIVVFCKSGGRSSQAKNILNQNGFNNVINGGTWKTVDQVVSK